MNIEITTLSTLSLKDADWPCKLTITFEDDCVVYDPEITVCRVMLSQPNQYIMCGYDNTPPMRKLEGEVCFKKGDTKLIEIELKTELSKEDPEEITHLNEGTASLGIGGVFWLKSGAHEFKSKKEVNVKI